MRRRTVAAMVVWCAIVGCGRVTPGEVPTLQERCLEATRKAVGEEVARAERELAGAKADKVEVAKIEERLKKLREDGARYEKMKPEEYLVPEPLKVKAKLVGPEDGLLYLEVQSRNGPWYNVIGSREKIRKDVMYEMTVYRVYAKRYFTMESWWVYVEERK